MIDPTTSATSMFAFTGDPTEQTGWIGTHDDVRSLISLEPFSLAPGERKFFTVVWIFAEGENLSHGLGKLRAYHDVIESRRDVWDY